MKEGVVFTLFLIALTSACDTINQLFLKSAINSLTAPSGNILKIAKFIFKLILIPRVWISFLFSIISLCIWLFVLSRADLSFAFSADSMHYVFIAVASRFVLKERVSFRRWLGIVFIIIGITIISFT
ncbi:MAG: EamA family transporter [Candidatus Omnitrophica bacterium]|nr:EamA family transporter [Candidatus Omnitrophota bacterium]MDD3987556.1 EamA family transporter [Candidatus Omnitrophota bacterium]MDD4981509.1 EamA family transporter [Candidatus Omnitrophota bacterium]MDD5665420.1 EamA family transporter [Candidatus Omnitrophota bacterium]